MRFLAIAAITAMLPLFGAAARGADIHKKPHAQVEVEFPDVGKSEWQYLLRNEAVVIRWSASPLATESGPTFQADTHLALRLVKNANANRANVIVPTDQTNFQKNDNQAAVAAAVSGRGQGVLELTVGMADEPEAAGEYCTTVVVTVSSN